jgi:hypothetical protein
MLWASDANTGVNPFIDGNGAKTELLDYPGLGWKESTDPSNGLYYTLTQQYGRPAQRTLQAQLHPTSRLPKPLIRSECSPRSRMPEAL